MNPRTLLALALLLTMMPAAGLTASPRGPGGLSLTIDAAGVMIGWSPGSAELAAMAFGEPPAPQLIALRLPDGADANPQIIAAAGQPWAGEPPLPTSALAILREGRLRGQRIAVYALSPVYLAGGSPTSLISLDARIPGAAPLGAADAWLADPNAPFLAAAPAPDPIANRQAWTIRVSQGGIQTLSLAALQAAGVSLSGINPARLRLWRGGAAVPLDLYPSGQALSELRFYAPPPGDRYNSADTYWLTVEAAPVPTMTLANAQPTGTVACQGTATVAGVWQARTLYDQRLAGPDGDHFFAAELKVAPIPADVDVVSATLGSSPLKAAGQVSLTVAGASLFTATHTISVTLAGTERSVSWPGTAVFSHSLDFPSFPAGAAQAEIALMPGLAANGVHIDSVTWRAAAQLNFALKGAAFIGPSGHGCHSLSQLPAGAALYDVSDSATPQRLIIGASSFEVDAATERSYLLAGPGTLQAPEISAHAPVNLARPLDAQAIYIAPGDFVSALAPLVAQRTSRGYSVAVVRAQDIYDTWAGGQASPAAIRSFLRYAAATWSVKPIAVTLVGDGTSDPRNYLGIGQTSWIPPYLAAVDPELGETACENCFAQLDGDSPLADWLPDMLIGRLPVKSAGELGQLAQKIIAYETAKDIGAWRGRTTYLADNTDTAGDFAHTADVSAAGLPADVEVARVYYDPAATDDQPWRVRDSYAAFERAFDALDSGAAVVSYIGHGHPYQWAYTGPPQDPKVPQDRQYLMNVDFAGDLTNGPRLPVVLSLTCLTGEFQIPSVRGTTVDEALVLNPRGGAIATWSAAGLGVLHGHDALQRGFLGALWGAQAGAPAALGALAMAGYQELFSAGNCCQDALRTYGLLGDPLTPVRTQTGVREVALPLVRR